MVEEKENIKSKDVENQVEQNKEIEEKEPDPVDCTVEIEIAVGALSARVYAHQPLYNGKSLDKGMVVFALQEAGVTFGINEMIISDMVKKQEYEEWVTVAESQAAVNGENGSVKYLIDVNQDKSLKEDANGYVDYKDLGLIHNITKGTVIAEITEPTDGEPGINIKNEPIIQIKGKPAKVPFSDNISYSEDNSKVIAQSDGNLVIKGGRYCIDPVYRLSGDVDTSTGNIDFIGEVFIKGDVKEGFKVKAKKNIQVNGGVFGASIESEGDIVIRQGAIGSTITATGKVQIDFCEKVKIRCAEQLKCKSLYFCDVFCNGLIDISLGAGSIIGGNTVSTQNINVNNLGSQSYTPTVVVIGDNAIMLTEKDNLIKDITALEGEIDNCKKIIDFLQIKSKQFGALPPEKIQILKSATNTVIVKRKEMLTKKARIEEIDNYLKIKQNRNLTCRRFLYPGCKITINDQIMVINTVYQHCQLNLGKGGIDVCTL